MTDKECSDYVEWINNRLLDMSKRPQMWGTQEGVEMQYLQLLEFKDLVRNPQFLGVPNQRYVIDKYVEFLQKTIPGRVPGYLHQLDMSWEAMMESLRNFGFGLEQSHIFKKR